MCGIVGIFDLTVPSVDKEQLKIMTNTLTHRGPDGDGFYVDGSIGLGHRRLSIIDLAGGKQPMSNENGTIWITYNGEIYNFQSIRSDLKNKGHIFKTNSDTEVIIHAYEEYGYNCLDLFRGMFAFGLWDNNKKLLFLARDRIGKKPLYYYFDGKRIIFASEIKAILPYKEVERTINYDALIDYFIYHYIPFPRSIFNNIYKIPPAHYLLIKPEYLVNESIHHKDQNRLIEKEKVADAKENSKLILKQTAQKLDLTLHEYWDLKFDPDYSRTETDWIEELKELINESVKLRLVSDVPLGAFLSGGIDSSSTAIMMKLVSQNAPKTFTIGFQENDYDEIEYARQIANSYNTDHHEYTVKPDAIKMLQKLSWAFDEPFADSSAIPTYYVSKMARQHVTVILSGDGGDEAFAGYDRYKMENNFQKFDIIPILARKLLFGGLSAVLPLGTRGKGLLRNLAQPFFLRSIGSRTFDGGGYLSRLLNRDLFKPYLEKRDDLNKNYTFLKQFYDKQPGIDPISKLQYEDIKTYLAEDIMTKVDRASMLCSLETRAPLLDHKLLEFVARMPVSLQMKNGNQKYMLKRSMDEYLPSEIMNRKKKGFEVPIKHWFKTDMINFAKSVLLSDNCKMRVFFDYNFIENILNENLKKHKDLSSHIWALLFFEFWCQNWLK